MQTLKYILFIVALVIICGLLFARSVAVEKKVMAIDYCFAELADGSLYHYVCEE